MRPIKSGKLLGDLQITAEREGLNVEFDSSRGSHVLIKLTDPVAEKSLSLVLPATREISPGVQRGMLGMLRRAADTQPLAQKVLRLLEIRLEASPAITPDEGAEIVSTRSYLSGGPKEESEEIFDIAAELASELGYDLTVQGDLKSGSWFQDIFLSGKKALANKEVQARVAAMEDALFGHANIDVDLKVVEMTAKLVTALSENDSHAAVVDSGLFLFIKLSDGSGGYDIFAKRLTLSDRATLNEDPTIVQTPAAVLDRLKDARKIRVEKLREIDEAAASSADTKPLSVEEPNGHGK